MLGLMTLLEPTSSTVFGSGRRVSTSHASVQIAEIYRPRCSQGSPTRHCTFLFKNNVLARQQLIYQMSTSSVNALGNLNGNTFNFGAAISAFARDNANEYILDTKYNELDLEDFGVGLSNSSQGAGVFGVLQSIYAGWARYALQCYPVGYEDCRRWHQNILRYLMV